MIALHTAPEPYTPPWYNGVGPVFMVRAGTVTERERFEAEMAGEHDAGKVWDFQIDAAFAEGIAVLLAGSPEQIEEVEGYLALEKEVSEHNAGTFVRSLGVPEEERAAFVVNDERKMPATERQALDEIRRLLREYWPDYRALIAQQERRWAMAPLVAFRRFCTGWEGLDTPYELGPDRMVSQKALLGVERHDIKAVGNHAYRLLYFAGEETTRKNSKAPSKSGNAPATSRSGAASGRGGRSRASAGRKTRP